MPDDSLSILHISDLHRDLENELGNHPLLESLARDIDRYEQNSPPIKRPQLCIVSGDLVYGVKPRAADVATELRRQYDQALDFLGELADRVFAGDRARVVLVPGNHDVCYDVLASAARIPVPNDERQRTELVAELFKTRSKLRWSWRELCFYRINDEVRYAARLSQFAAAYQAFYRGERTYSTDAGRQLAVFEYPDLQLTVLGFNSCYENDPLRRAGAFHPDCLAEASRRMRMLEHSGRLVAAVWHHSLFGGPTQDDYVDSSVLEHFIDAGVSLCFHGHQHRAQCVEERYQISGDNRKIVVVSAGTLCAGPKHLHPGDPRSYNVVEVNRETLRCRIHQRRMHNNDFDFPIWSPGLFTETGKSFIDVSIEGPARPRPSDLDATLRLERADRMIGAGQWREAIGLLTSCSPDSLARPLLARALLELAEPKLIMELLWPPKTAGEAVLLGQAILDAGTRAQADAYLALRLVEDQSDASIVEVAQRVRQRWRS